MTSHPASHAPTSATAFVAIAGAFGASAATLVATPPPQLLALLPAPALLLDQHGYVCDANDAMLALLKRPSAEVVHCWFGTMVEPTNRPALDQVLHQAFADPNGPQHSELVLQSPGDALQLVRFSVAQVPHSAPQLLLAVVQQQDEWLGLLQSVLALNAELAARNTELTQFNEYIRHVKYQREHVVDLLVHDIRGPLVATSASLQIVRRAIADMAVLAPYQALMSDAVDAGLRSLDAVVELTNSLLDVKKLISGHYVLSLGDVAVEALYDGIKAAVQSLAVQQQVAFRIACAPGLVVSADQHLLRRVIMNLVSNALRFAPAGSLITLEAQVVDNNVLLSVSDRGPGVPPADRERIFLPFAQGAGEQQRGTGLGLAFCREVVAAHHGRIWIEDTPGGGSRFCVRLPC